MPYDSMAFRVYQKYVGRFRLMLSIKNSNFEINKLRVISVTFYNGTTPCEFQAFGPKFPLIRSLSPGVMLTTLPQHQNEEG